MKKGFTLVELLAVIAVLGIISTIIIPIVYDIVTDSQIAGLIESANAYVDAVEYSIKNKNINEEFNPSTCVVQKSGNLLCDGVSVEVNVNKNIPTSGVIKLKNGVMESVTNLKIDNSLLSTDSNKEFIVQ